MKALQKAKKMIISLGKLIRKSLEAMLNNKNKKTIEDPLFANDAVFHDQGPEDLALNHDRYLHGD